ncbi:RNA-directed DNA polymerase, eukaryota, reverse transcriptase zinc-binding domain protein [Tanacetum coccineum]
MSIEGRLTLVKSVLGSLPLSLMAKNWELVGKWWWQFKLESDVLWLKLIKSIYGESGGLEGDGVGPRAGRSGLWRDIVKVGLDIDKIGVGRLGWLIKGDGVRGESWHWNFSEDDNFKVKDLTFVLDDIYLRVGNKTQDTLWNKLAPKKVNVFVWRVLHGRIPIRVELDKRGVELDSILCPCCDESLESCDHSLVMCNVAKSVWDKIFKWWKISPINVFSANDLFCCSGNVAVESYSRALW